MFLLFFGFPRLGCEAHFIVDCWWVIVAIGLLFVAGQSGIIGQKSTDRLGFSLGLFLELRRFLSFLLVPIVRCEYGDSFKF